MTDTIKSSKPPWDEEVWNVEMDSNIRFPKAPAPTRFYDESQSSNQTKEEVARLHEENSKAVKKYRFEKQDELEAEKARRGRIMHANEFLYRLRKISNIRAWLQDQGIKPGMIALVVARKTQAPQYVGWAQYPYMTEYSILWTDSHGLPLNEKYRGWRTLLLKLILGGFITELEAENNFGKATGWASTRYNQQLYGFRNRSNQ